MLKNVKLHLVETIDDVNACLKWLDALTCTHLGLDTEGTGISPEIDSVRLVQFGDRDTGWAIPIDRWYGLVEEIVRRWNKRGRYVAHNAPYDVAMLRNHGIIIPVHLVDDTMTMAHIVNPTVSIGLKQQSRKHVDPLAASMQRQLDEVMHSGGYTWATVPIAPTGPLRSYWLYGALDPVLTVRLRDTHWPEVARVAPRAYDLELAVCWLAERMERKGVLCDREYTAKKHAEFVEIGAMLMQRGKDEFGVQLGSASQIIDVLTRDGVQLTKRTPQGAFSLDKEALQGISHPLASLLKEHKHVEKLTSTYLRRFLEYSERDGRIHPSINTLGFKEQSSSGFGVVTSRMSMSNPNLQQLPRGGDKYADVIRNCIVAKPGHTFVMCDFDQVELRIMAHLSKDPGLAEAFAAGGDFFTTLTRKIYRDPSITKSDKRRSLTKAYVYATLYGAGNDKLATTTGVPLAEIERLAGDFSAAYGHVALFQLKVQADARQRLRAEGVAYAVSPLTGRRLIGEKGKEYRLVNYMIQSMAAEIMKTKALEIDAAGLGDYLVLFVHDEYILEVPDEMLHDVCRTLNEVVNDDTLLTIPLTAGLATGKTWGSKVDYELAS